MKLHPFVLRCALAALVLSDAAAAGTDEFFTAEIEPILQRRCYECHSHEAGKSKGGLTLDSRSGWSSGGESGPAIVPGRPGESLLMQAVRRESKELAMPPKEKLPEAEIAALERWVRTGAADPRQPRAASTARAMDFAAGRQHWAFRPVTAAAPPGVTEEQWPRNEVDRFILARLEAAGLHPSAEADRRTWIRRATFDVTGLPPTPAEVEAFLRDDAPEAFATVVDRLLASPHYGEHWARHWLDVARYSDTKGYVYAREEKQFVHAWAYRDWVAGALNDDMPYDRFLLLQIAADQIEAAGSPHLAAMGFLTLGRRFLGVTHDIYDDRIDVLMRGTQGLTVACARCHDHKFDPISARDYYALYGVFQSCAEALVPCGEATNANAVAAKEGRAREEKLREALARRREEQAARVRGAAKEYLLAQLELEKYPEENFSQILGAGDINPLFVRRWQSFLAAAAERHDPRFAAWHGFARLQPADFATRAASVTEALGAPLSPYPRLAKSFATAPASMREVAERYGALFAQVEADWRALLKAEPTTRALPDAEVEALRQVLYGAESPCTVPDEHLANIEWFFPTGVTVELWKLQGEVDRWLLESADAAPRAMILVDRAQPANPRVFKRGNPLTKGEAVPRRFLQVLAGDDAPPFTQGSGRLELARAIASRENPLTARVMVNRVWAQHFGQGIVSTPSDFGKQGSAPSHPELLDWLAERFMEEGWSLKALHRRILLSATYRQTALAQAGDPACAHAMESDPQNRLLWRMNPHRLSFEEMRDAWLAASGELDGRVGGKPQDLFAPENRRRTLYARIDRERLPAVMRTFDFANPDLSIPQRNDTIVPQQALFTLNHPFVAARARALVKRTESDHGESSERVRTMYRMLFQRAPAAAELAAAVAFVEAEPGAPAERKKPNAWQYGFGEWDEEGGRLKSFNPLPHFDGKAYHGGERLPDAKLGWAQLTATGGHPGNDRRHAVVRRWVAPQDGPYAIASTVTHEPASGDGIRAFISYSGDGLLRSAVVHH